MTVSISSSGYTKFYFIMPPRIALKAESSYSSQIRGNHLPPVLPSFLDDHEVRASKPELEIVIHRCITSCEVVAVIVRVSKLCNLRLVVMSLFVEIKIWYYKWIENLNLLFASPIVFQNLVPKTGMTEEEGELLARL